MLFERSLELLLLFPSLAASKSRVPSSGVVVDAVKRGFFGLVPEDDPSLALHRVCSRRDRPSQGFVVRSLLKLRVI